MWTGTGTEVHVQAVAPNDLCDPSDTFKSRNPNVFFPNFYTAFLKKKKFY